MRVVGAVLLGLSVLASACSGDGVGDVAGQAATSVPADAGDRSSSALLVIDASSAVHDGSTLTLAGVEQELLLFADRPSRVAERLATADVIEQWDAMFGDDPPNVAVSWTEADGRRESVVELTDPVLDGDTLRFSSRAVTTTPDRLTGLVHTPVETMPTAMEDVSLFVDDAAPLLRWVAVTVVNETGGHLEVELYGVGVPPYRKDVLTYDGAKATFTAVEGPVTGGLGFAIGGGPAVLEVANLPLVPVTVSVGNGRTSDTAFYKEGQTRYITEDGHRYRIRRDDDTGSAVEVTITVES